MTPEAGIYGLTELTMTLSIINANVLHFLDTPIPWTKPTMQEMEAFRRATLVTSLQLK